MEKLQTILLNFLIFFALLGLCLVLPPIALKVLGFGQMVFPVSGSNTDARALLPAYEKSSWAEKHFEEFASLKTDYKDYFVWRRRDFRGETINIVDGLRTTAQPRGTLNTNEYWFFGGSTTWGTGVNDENTYPSVFAADAMQFVRNFGESGYIAAQSLFFLQAEVLLTERFDLSGVTVVFLDGVNDVASRCRVQSEGLGSSREYLIASRMSDRASRYSFAQTFAQLSDFLSAVRRRLANNGKRDSLLAEGYDCHTNSIRAQEIASSLVATWMLANDVVESRGGTFYGVLQPVSLQSRQANRSEIFEGAHNDLLAKQFSSVYPLIQTELRKQKAPHLINLISVFDDCSTCYIDFAHFGPKGSELIATELLERVHTKPPSDDQ